MSKTNQKNYEAFWNNRIHNVYWSLMSSSTMYIVYKDPSRSKAEYRLQEMACTYFEVNDV
jgi:hypothetical protein